MIEEGKRREEKRREEKRREEKRREEKRREEKRRGEDESTNQHDLIGGGAHLWPDAGTIVSNSE